MYPVSIDPSLVIQGTNNTHDTFVEQANPTVNHGLDTYLVTGTYPAYGICRSLIQFDLQPLLSGAKITSAQLTLNQYSTVATQQVNLYPITTSWTSTGATWNNQPTIGSLLTSTNVGGVGSYNWDITSLTQGWYNGTTQNKGVELRLATETNDRKSFYSSDYATDPTLKPKLTITYTINPLGSEPFWTTAVSNVNTYNGNFFLPETDVNIPGRGIPAEISRYYNSLSNSNGIFGANWTSNLEQHLIDSGDGPIQYVDGDGTTHSFTPNGDGTYSTTQDLQLWLTKNGDGTYTLTNVNRDQYSFDTTGLLTSITDSNGNKTTITWTSGVPTQVTDASGRITTLTYSGNLVSQVTDPANNTTNYSYSNGDLISVTKKNSTGSVLSTKTFGYDGFHHITSITDANNNKKTIQYNPDNTVASISYPITVSGTVQTATYQFTYDPTNQITTVTDPKGTKTVYTHNDYGNVIQITQDPTGLNYKQSFTYNNQNQLISKKDANTNANNGSATYNYSYDSNGNLKTVTTPLNNSTQSTYDSNNNLISKTDPNGNTTTNQYDNNNNQTSITDPAVKSSAKIYDIYGNVTSETSEMSPGNNLVMNSSFEVDKNGVGWPDHWNKRGPDTSIITWDSPGLTTNGITLGNKSVKITNPTAATAVTSDPIPYDPTKTYFLSEYAKTQNANGIATVVAVGFDANGNVTQTIYGSGISGTQGPTRLHLALEPNAFPSNTKTFDIRGYVTGGPSGYGGTFWFDGMQVETGYFGAYNIVENGDLETDANLDNIPDYWYASADISSGADGLDTSVYHAGTKSFRITGNSTQWKALYQAVNLSGGAGATLTVSGFSKVQSPNPNGGFYGYIIETYSGTTLQETFTYPFDKTKAHDWQQQAAQLTTTKSFDNIKVYYEYSQQSGTAWFDTAKVLIGSVTTNHQYDTDGNYETKTTDPMGRTTQMSYDTVGNMLNETIGADPTIYAYDGLSRLTQVTDAQNHVTQYQYDGNGNRTKVINANNKATTFQYNELNQIKQVTDANNKSTNYEYDLNGNQTKISYANGNTVEYGYNSVNRPTSVTHNGTQRYSFEYDPNGNLTKETDQASGLSTNYTYDGDNRVLTIQEPNSNQTDYTNGYDKNGNVTQRKLTAGSTTITQGYSYNSQDQLTNITVNGTNNAWFTYNEKDQVASRKTGDKTNTLNSYNGAGDLVEQAIYDKNGSLVDDFKYTYDTKGRITSVVSNAGTTSYVYDQLDQLTKETRPDGTIYEYTYDAVGNRLTKKVTQGSTSTTTNYTYDDADQLTAVGSTSYTYDANGNLINDGNRTYAYDAENRLLSVKDSSNTTIASFTYRADGMRQTMTTSTGTITFHYDENKNVTYETDGSNQVVASYTYNSKNEPVSMIRGGQTYYYQLNGHGDVVKLTDSNGTVVATYDYDAYGNIVSETGTVVNPYRYAGYRYDKETGLYYLQNRYYNPSTGRFLTRDAIEGTDRTPLTFNKYAYAGNNPVGNIDPDGNRWHGGYWSGNHYTKWVHLTRWQAWAAIGFSVFILDLILAGLASVFPISIPVVKYFVERVVLFLLWKFSDTYIGRGGVTIYLPGHFTYTRFFGRLWRPHAVYFVRNN